MQKGRLWNECSDVLNYDFNHDSMLPLYEYFLNSTTLRVWVYSGNFDSVLPTTGTMNWIARLGRTVMKEWQPWTGDWCPTASIQYHAHFISLHVDRLFCMSAHSNLTVQYQPLTSNWVATWWNMTE
jgi:hypothetical protein